MLTALAVLLTAVDARDELRDVIAEADGTNDTDDTDDMKAPPLRRAERLNLVLVTVLVTMMQFVLLAVLVFAFFALFGIPTVPEATAQAWLGEPPTRLTGILGRMPVSTALLKVCLVLGAFAALNFVATAGADRQ